MRKALSFLGPTVVGWTLIFLTVFASPLFLVPYVLIGAGLWWMTWRKTMNDLFGIVILGAFWLLLTTMLCPVALTEPYRDKTLIQMFEMA
jgi:hypothetical protein